jgi:UDP-glucose 4-epimerase
VEKKVSYVVTGGAGFIGSHLVDSLLSDSSTNSVLVIDNFSSGREEHLSHVADSRLSVKREDLLNLDSIKGSFQDIDVVFHLAANPDARWGISNTRLDLEQETIATYNVLEAMRVGGCSRILLSSSGTVYGDIGTIPAHEKLGPSLPVSLYGAGKVASEALLSGFCGTFGMTAMILRFGNIIGERTTHGVIFDFIKRLAANPSRLTVLGDGRQAKPYVYVKDLVSALRHAERLMFQDASMTCDVYNVAPHDSGSVRFIAETLVKALKLTNTTTIEYGTTAQGWPGDVAQSRMDASKLFSTGFSLQRTSEEAIETAIAAILEWLQTRPETGDGLMLPASYTG